MERPANQNKTLRGVVPEINPIEREALVLRMAMDNAMEVVHDFREPVPTDWKCSKS
jgi:hypothetical protein